MEIGVEVEQVKEDLRMVAHVAVEKERMGELTIREKAGQQVIARN